MERVKPLYYTGNDIVSIIIIICPHYIIRLQVGEVVTTIPSM